MSSRPPQSAPAGPWRFASDRRGTAAIELAIGMLPLVILLLGGITYGGVFATMLAMNHAANEGARSAIAGLSLCEREARAESSARDALIFANLKDAATVTGTATADEVRVDISFAYQASALTPVLFPVPETLTASAIARTDGPELPAAGC